jgi:acetylornithine deacetylase/succinyl-diaminopimelate desuccinylase-like protein
MLRSLLDPSQADRVLDGLGDAHLAAMVRAMLHNTATPTILRAGEKTNVIPSVAEAQVDCRILPGETPETLRGQLEAVLAECPGVEIELGMSGQPTESPVDTDLAGAIRRSIARHAPEARTIPYLVPGATDSRFLRPRGVVAYGFCPLLPGEDVRSIHGNDERVGVRSIEFGLRVLWDVVTDFICR